LILHISAQSVPQLFEKTADELLKTLIDPQVVSEALREKVVVEAGDTALLLKGWVNALINLVAEQRIIFKSFRFQVFDAERTGAGRLKAEVTGELIDPLRHVFKKEAASWRCEQVRLENGAKSIEAQVVLESRQIGS